ncbi:MAG: hypothetical protein RL029_812, partial [Actinomycetota bacterium]
MKLTPISRVALSGPGFPLAEMADYGIPGHMLRESATWLFWWI